MYLIPSLPHMFPSHSLFYSSLGPRSTRFCKYYLIPSLWEETEPQSICLPAGSCRQLRQQLNISCKWWRGEWCSFLRSQKPPKKLYATLCLLTLLKATRFKRSQRAVIIFSWPVQKFWVMTPLPQVQIQGHHPEGQSKGLGLLLLMDVVQSSSSNSWLWEMCEGCPESQA